MPAVKVTVEDGSTHLIAAKSLSELFEKASKKFNKNFDAFLRRCDQVKIEDDEVFKELIQPGQPELHLIAIETGAKPTKAALYSKKNNKSPCSLL